MNEHVTTANRERNEPPKWQSIVSLVLFIHLFCLAIGLSGQMVSSQLHLRLRRVLAPYSHLLNLDPQFSADLALTQAMIHEDDHVWVVRAVGGEVVSRYPDETMARGGFRAQRWRNFMRRCGAMAVDEDDEALAEVVRGLGQLETSRDGGSPKSGQDRRWVMELRRHLPREFALPGSTRQDPAEDEETIFIADVWQDAQGLVRVNKRIAASDAAQVAPHRAPPKPAATK